MLLEFQNNHMYNLIEESKIVTECGALYKAQDMEFNRTIAVKVVDIQGENKIEKKLSYEKAYSEVRAMVSLGEENLPMSSAVMPSGAFFMCLFLISS